MKQVTDLLNYYEMISNKLLLNTELHCLFLEYPYFYKFLTANYSKVSMTHPCYTIIFFGILGIQITLPL